MLSSVICTTCIQHSHHRVSRKAGFGWLEWSPSSQCILCELPLLPCSSPGSLESPSTSATFSLISGSITRSPICDIMLYFGTSLIMVLGTCYTYTQTHTYSTCISHTHAPNATHATTGHVYHVHANAPHTAYISHIYILHACIEHFHEPHTAYIYHVHAHTAHTYTYWDSLFLPLTSFHTDSVER